MEAIRKIISADALIPIIDLPWASKDVQVEVIVLPLNEEVTYPTTFVKSLKGCLNAYANPALKDKEKHAWEINVGEKYGHS